MSVDTHGYIYSREAREIAEQWRTFKGFTVRPVPSTEAFYDRSVAAYSTTGSRVMIYGGTPELRDCTYRHRRATTLVDRSALMVTAMGSLTECGRSLAPHEQFVECDWASIPVEAGRFDLLLGDDAINMVGWSRFREFLDESRRVLRPGGVFVCHLLVKPDDELIDQKLEEVLAEYRAGRIGSRYDLASRINFVNYDRSTYMMGWQRSIAGLTEALRRGVIEDDAGFSQHFQLCNSSFACPPQGEFEALLAGRYEVVEVFYPTEYDYCRSEPLYVLKRLDG